MHQHKQMKLPIRPSNPSPLELAIHRYEVEAIKFHNKRAKKAATEGTAKSQLEDAAFSKDWEHLKRQRRMLAAQVQIQGELTEYRNSCKEKSPAELRNEPHHPTTVLSRNLTAIGEPKPSTVHDPHHIIMGTGRFRKMQMAMARLNLHVFGVGINDPINGVWLPRNKVDKRHWATPDAPSHKEIHRYNYETWVTSLLSNDALPEAVYLNRLKSIKNQLKTGTYPSQIVEKKDSEWRGA